MSTEPELRLPQALIELYMTDARILEADEEYLRVLVSNLDEGDPWSVGVHAKELSGSLKKAFPALDFPLYHLKQFDAETFVQRTHARFREQLPLARSVLAQLEALRASR